MKRRDKQTNWHDKRKESETDTETTKNSPNTSWRDGSSKPIRSKIDGVSIAFILTSVGSAVKGQGWCCHRTWVNTFTSLFSFTFLAAVDLQFVLLLSLTSQDLIRGSFLSCLTQEVRVRVVLSGFLWSVIVVTKVTWICGDDGGSFWWKHLLPNQDSGKTCWIWRWDDEEPRTRNQCLILSQTRE